MFQLFFLPLSLFGLFLVASPESARAESPCLMASPVQCDLKADHTGFRISVDERGRIVVAFGRSPREIDHGDSYVVIQDDLARLEEAQYFSENEAEVIKKDLTPYDGAVYSIPPADEVRLALGFPTNTPTGPRDYFDLIHVHMQLVLSVSALTANYLGDLMGLLLTEDESVARPAEDQTQP